MIALPPLLVEDGTEVMDESNSSDGSVNADVDGSSSFIVEDLNMLDEDEVDNDGGCATKNLPQRKMTDLTAESSFMDDDLVVSNGEPSVGYLDDDDSLNKDHKPLLASLHEVDDECYKALEVGNSCWRGVKNSLLFLVVFVILAFGVVVIGAHFERKSYEVKPGTHRYYQIPQVCGVDDPLTDSGVTFGSALEAKNNGALVAHCGDCGACSTAQDMAIMARTTNSLTRDSTHCAFKSFFGLNGVQKCMEERVGFTPACEECWLENIACSFRACKFTCIKYKLFRQSNNKGGDELNDCLQCDERSCGPGFIQCSGANRRRMGIISDIGREVQDQCSKVNVDWINLPSLEDSHN